MGGPRAGKRVVPWPDVRLRGLFMGSGSDGLAQPSTCRAIAQAWPHIRVDGLGILPELVCPHFDRTQSNGIPRALDFDSMMLKHPGEIGLGLAHRAALLVADGAYEVISRGGRPSMWVKRVEAGRVHTEPAPRSGRIGDILEVARYIEKDPLADVCRAQNPSLVPAP